MNRIILAVTALLAATPAAAAERSVVLELFTSQGCSSCPPADALLQELAREPGIIALSRPVDYWDKLGWRDTLARPENTEKQRAYAGAINGSNRVYTPQLVIDGRSEAVGSDEGSVRRLIETARRRGPEAVISAHAKAGQVWQVAVTGADGAEVHLIGYLPHAHVVIKAGENEGAEIDYSNAVRRDLVLGKAGTPLETPDLAAAAEGEALSWVIVVQQGKAGPIGGALALMPES